MTNQRIVHNLKGIFPPVVTPFNRRDDVDEKQFRENLQKYAGTGLGGVVVAGSTGEALSLNEAERLRLVEIARDVVRPPELLLVGTGLESTRETIRLSREAIARGADALLVLPPHYYKPKMDAPALIAHFEELAGNVKRPVILYSIPQFTGINMAAETIATLSRHPNIVGLKESWAIWRLLRRSWERARRASVFLLARERFFSRPCGPGPPALCSARRALPLHCVSVSMRPSAVGRRRPRANYNSGSFLWLRRYPCPLECPASRRRSTFRATTAAFRVLLCFPSAPSLTGWCRRR